MPPGSRQGVKKSSSEKGILMSANVDSLLTQRQTALTQATVIVNKARKEGRDLNDEEVETCNKLVKSAGVLEGRIEEIRNGLAASHNWGNQTQPQLTRNPSLGIPMQTGNPGGGMFRGDGASVADGLFGKKTGCSGFASFGDWLQTLDSGRFDQRMQAANKIGVDSDGGFLVPEVYQNMFIDAVIEKTILASRCRRFPMTSDTLHLNGFDGNDHSSNLFGGLAAAWEQEIPTLSEQSPTTRRTSFHARKLMILTQSSNELISDAAQYETMLGEALVQSTAWQLDYALLRGDGSGKPLGAIASDSKIEVAAEGSQTAATIWYSNILKMFSRLHPASYGSAIWVCNPSCLPELFTLDVHESATALGSALVGDYTYQPFRESDGKFTLFGRPVEVTEKLPVLGTAGDIVLLDPQQYGLGMRQEVIVEKSIHAGFSTDSSYFRSKLRCDGQPLWSKVMTPRAGSTLSWCVTLATRS